MSLPPVILIAPPIAIDLSELEISTSSPITIPSDELVVPFIPIAIPLLADATEPAPMAILPVSYTHLTLPTNREV